MQASIRVDYLGLCLETLLSHTLVFSGELVDGDGSPCKYYRHIRYLNFSRLHFTRTGRSPFGSVVDDPEVHKAQAPGQLEGRYSASAARLVLKDASPPDQVLEDHGRRLQLTLAWPHVMPYQGAV